MAYRLPYPLALLTPKQRAVMGAILVGGVRVDMSSTPARAFIADLDVTYVVQGLRKQGLASYYFDPGAVALGLARELKLQLTENGMAHL